MFAYIEFYYDGDDPRIRREKRGRKPLPNSLYNCETCGNSYKLIGNLNRHLRYECGVEPQFQCSYCPYKAKLKGNLNKHMANHKNNK